MREGSHRAEIDPFRARAGTSSKHSGVLPDAPGFADELSGHIFGELTLGTEVSRTARAVVYRVLGYEDIVVKVGTCAAISAEARILSRLRGVPGVMETIRLRGMSTDENYMYRCRGFCFIVVQYAGEVLTATSVRGNKSARAARQRDAAAVTLTVFDTLLRVHKKGILHGDLAPHNFVKHDFGGSGFVTLVNFESAAEFVGSSLILPPVRSRTLLTCSRCSDMSADLEMLLWTFVYLAMGELPWSSQCSVTGATENATVVNVAIFAEHCYARRSPFRLPNGDQNSSGRDSPRQGSAAVYWARRRERERCYRTRRSAALCIAFWRTRTPIPLGEALWSLHSRLQRKSEQLPPRERVAGAPCCYAVVSGHIPEVVA